MVFQHSNILDGYDNYIDYYKEMPKRNLMNDYIDDYAYKTKTNETIRDLHNDIGINSAKIRKLERDLTMTHMLTTLYTKPLTSLVVSMRVIIRS